MNKERLYLIETCAFRRSSDSVWEMGLALNEGHLGIIDEYGCLVLSCWEYRAVPGLSLVIDTYMSDQYLERFGFTRRR